MWLRHLFRPEAVRLRRAHRQPRPWGPQPTARTAGSHNEVPSLIGGVVRPRKMCHVKLALGAPTCPPLRGIEKHPPDAVDIHRWVWLESRVPAPRGKRVPCTRTERPCAVIALGVASPKERRAEPAAGLLSKLPPLHVSLPRPSCSTQPLAAAVVGPTAAATVAVGNGRAAKRPLRSNNRCRRRRSRRSCVTTRQRRTWRRPCGAP